MENNVKNDWYNALALEFNQPYFKKLMQFLDQEYNQGEIYPPKDEIFNGFHYTPLNKVKVLVIGQDPYHDVNQAHGLAFSVGKGVKIPPSLKNIYKELEDDLGYKSPNHGDLKKWADEGVLLLNTILTVRAHEANSHKGKGWEEFTDAVIKEINKQNRPLVIILWGKPAQRKEVLLNNPKHLILKAPHPSPLSAYRGFFGSKLFSQVNLYLSQHGIEPIDWEIEDKID